MLLNGIKNSAYRIHFKNSVPLSLLRSVSTSVDESVDAYLHRTQIPTDFFQSSLPKLPIPKLEDTIRRYLLSCKPLLSDEEYKETEKATHEFLNGVGPKLQSQLEKKNALSYSNYVSKPWFDVYLEARQSLLITTNPQITLRRDERRSSQPDLFHTKPKLTKTSFFTHLINMIPRSVSFYASAACGAYALDMSQYDRALFYKVDVLDDRGLAISQSIVEKCFQEIIDAKVNESDDVFYIGSCTSLPRNDWARLRHRIESQSCINSATLHDIDSSLFMVSLDDEDILNQDLNQDFKNTISNIASLCRTMLHGNQCRDRWLDKSFQIIVTKSGEAAINFEHSWGDGVAVLRFCTEIVKHCEKIPVVNNPNPREKKKQKWDICDETKAMIRNASDQAGALISSTDIDKNHFFLKYFFIMYVFQSLDFNAIWMKNNYLSPDGVMQMLFQLSHHYLFGVPASTYESACMFYFFSNSNFFSYEIL
eukprot:GSMAST32.ASY1.ANO1.2234.1 assembled CDS